MCATRWGNHYVFVVIFSQQSTNSKPSMTKVLDVKIQIMDSLLSVPMCDLHLYLPKRHPLRRLAGHTRSLETQTAGQLSLHPWPCDVDFLEIRHRASGHEWACPQVPCLSL